MGSVARVTSAAEGLPRRRFTVAEVEAMVAAGVMEEDERVELIGGELVPMSPKGNHHEVLKAALLRSRRPSSRRSPPDADLASISSHVNANGRDFLVTDLVSAEPLPPLNRKMRIVAAASQQGEQTWFVKMTGDVDLVEAQKNHFIEFLRNLSIAGGVRSDESSVR